MTKAKWLELAERCEKATGPDRKIDLAIARIRGVVVMRRNDDDTGYEEHTYWDVTASLDAITALIERELPGHGHGYTLHDPAEKQAVAHVANEDDDVFGTSAATPALALCAAFCRAMAERATE